MDQRKIGTFIADMRKEKGLTQAQLAEKLNVSGKTVSRWETGKKKTILILLLILALVIGVVMWFAIGVGLSVATMTSAQLEINTDITFYNEYMGPDARREYRNKCNIDESIFPAQITEDMHVADYKMVYYNPWDPQWLSYLVVDYDDAAWEEELKRLNNYPSTEYIGYYGTSGFSQYDLLAVCTDEDYNGLVYALDDQSSQRIIYVEIIFCNYFMDIDYEEYISDAYLPDGFDAKTGNSIRKKFDTERTLLHFQT